MIWPGFTPQEERQISMIEDAINDDRDYLVKFQRCQKIYKNEKVKVYYEFHPNFVQNSSDWIGLFPCDWASSFHYITFEWADVNTDRHLKEIELQLDKIRVPADEKFQFLYVSENCVIGGSDVFEIRQPDKCKCEYESQELFPEFVDEAAGPSSNSVVTTDSDGSFELLDPCDELCSYCSETESCEEKKSTVWKFNDLPSPCQRTPEEDAATTKASDPITLTETVTPAGESIYNWLKDIEEEECVEGEEEEEKKEEKKEEGKEEEVRKEEEKKGQDEVKTDNHMSFNVLKTKIDLEEVDDNNNPVFSNPNVPYSTCCLEDLPSLSISEHQLDVLCHELCMELGKMQPPQVKKVYDTAQSCLDNLPPNPDITCAVLCGITSVQGIWEEENKELMVQKSSLEEKLQKMTNKNKKLTKKKNEMANKLNDLEKELKEEEEISEFRKILLEGITDILASTENERRSLQTANDMLSERNGRLEKNAAMKKKERVRLATSASMAPKYLQEISALKEQIEALKETKEGNKSNNGKLPEVEKDNEKLRRELADLKKQQNELQNQYEDILQSLFHNGVTGLVKKNSNGNMTIISTGKKTDSFNVTSGGVQANNGKMVEIQNWRNVQSSRSAKQMRMIDRQQEKIESLVIEQEELKEKLKKEQVSSTDLKRQLKKSEDDKKELKEKLAELEKINSFLSETVNLQSRKIMPQPLEITRTACTQTKNCDAGPLSLESLSQSSPSVSRPKNVRKRTRSSVNALTNTPHPKQKVVGINTSQEKIQNNKQSIAVKSASTETVTTNTTSFCSMVKPPPCKVNFIQTIPADGSPIVSTPLAGVSDYAGAVKSLQLIPYSHKQEEEEEEERISNSDNDDDDDNDSDDNLFPESYHQTSYEKLNEKHNEKRITKGDLEMKQNQLNKLTEKSQQKLFKNVNFSANTHNREKKNSIPPNLTEDVLTWGIEAMTTFADKCESEIKNLYNYFEKFMQAESNKTSFQTNYNVINETASKRKPTSHPDSVVCQIEEESPYCDYEFD